jgi:hypothetical protein
MTTKFEHFDTFVKTIDLNAYRLKYSHIKIVEMDLPKNIQALKALYKYYWSDVNIQNIPDFEQFYELYYKDSREEIEKFRIKTEMCETCFNKGLRARIYRTWASIITQIHAGYVAETVFGEGSVTMNDILDHEGKDFVISYHNKVIPVQVKKETHRPEARILRKDSKDIISIFYCVPAKSDFEKPYYIKTGLIKPQMLDFIKYSNDGILDRYDNGFVVFTDKVFKDLIPYFD